MDATVLGALQVDEKILPIDDPRKDGTRHGGAMDLVTGAKKVIIAMEHTAREIQRYSECTLPTAPGEVDLIVTEMAVIEVTKEAWFLKIRTRATVEDVKAATEADLIIADDLNKCTPMGSPGQSGRAFILE